ncbi:MAG TPA: hypothetical protein VF808_15175 [Ktedonobacterales bacterium]
MAMRAQRPRLRGRSRWRSLATALGVWLALASLAGCATASGGAATPASGATPAATAAPGTDYTDARLGYSLRIPAGWGTRPYPGAAGLAGVSAVMLSLPGSRVASAQVAVIESAAMPAAFARRGTPDASVGRYPAFELDVALNGARVPCLMRVFLAARDYVIASLCALDASSWRAVFERLLATYQPAAPGLVARAEAAPAAATCAQAWAAQRDGQLPAGWGRTLASAGAAGWRQLGAGVTVCSNTGSTDAYFYQCTELVNRFLLERWGLAHIPGNAARYMDYVLNGARYPGRAREFPPGMVAFSDDASQGMSAFAPQAGDLLIFQDVANPHAGWTSGLAASPGHIALITGVDATHVYVAQENYSDRAYFQALPLLHSARGWAISDRSGIPDRITRGWIRLEITAG